MMHTRAIPHHMMYTSMKPDPGAPMQLPYAPAMLPPAMMAFAKQQPYDIMMAPPTMVFPGYGYAPQQPQQPQQAQHQAFMPTMAMPPAYAASRMAVSPPDSVDVGTFQDLLDVALDASASEDATFDVQDGFDTSEMSILMSFLTEHEAPARPTADSAGVLSLNLMEDGPLEALLAATMDDDDDDDDCLVELAPPTGFVPMTSQPHVNLGDFEDDGLSAKNRRLCKMDGCHKRSRSHGLCIAHGGGRRCAVEGCNKSSQGGNLCIKHGGGKRCEVDGCERAAQSNMLCKAHGGGPRCLFEGCDRSSQGGGYCRSHGGGKRCLFEGCDKGTQRGDFCALHGGSRLCGVAGCMRNDRGGGFCATHGGGKRCAEPGCTKPCRRMGLCSAHYRVHHND